MMTPADSLRIARDANLTDATLLLEHHRAHGTLLPAELGDASALLARTENQPEALADVFTAAALLLLLSGPHGAAAYAAVKGADQVPTAGETHLCPLGCGVAIPVGRVFVESGEFDGSKYADEGYADVFRCIKYKSHLFAWETPFAEDDHDNDAGDGRP